VHAQCAEGSGRSDYLTLFRRIGANKECVADPTL
jgi:hypothetical protein